MHPDPSGYNRARIAGLESDAATLKAFDARQTDPGQYRDLLERDIAGYSASTIIEVVAEVDADPATGRERIVRVLRLTTDQAPSPALASGQVVPSGEFFFRGPSPDDDPTRFSAEVYTQEADGPVKRGRGRLENLRVDFDTMTVDVDVTTGVSESAGSEVRTRVDEKGIPFNVRTGVFGGPIKMEYWPETGDPITVDGQLRGSITADPASLRRQQEEMATSGLFTAGGPDELVSGSGVFWGRQLNCSECPRESAP